LVVCATVASSGESTARVSVRMLFGSVQVTTLYAHPAEVAVAAGVAALAVSITVMVGA
jgi:hypothetical protein